MSEEKIIKAKIEGHEGFIMGTWPALAILAEIVTTSTDIGFKVELLGLISAPEIGSVFLTFDDTLGLLKVKIADEQEEL